MDTTATATTHRHHAGLLIYIPTALARSPDFPFHAGQHLTASFTPTSLNLTPTEESI